MFFDITFSQFALFVVATLALNLTPGPDMVYAAANGMQRGMKAGIVSASGIGCGALVHAAFAAVGISAIIAASDTAYDILRIGGGGYLIWVGIKSFKEGGRTFSDLACEALPYRSLFVRGLITNILNPKVALFFIAFLPQFVRPESGNVAAQIFLLGCFIGISGTVINGLVGIFAGGAGRILLQNPLSARWISRISGSLIIALGARLFFMEKN